MAGIPLQTLQSGISGNNVRFVRTMPNTPVLVGQGVTGIFTQDESCKEEVESLLSSTSYIFYVKNEDDLNTVTAISGSGPAYFFAFIEALADAGEKLGLDREVAIQSSIRTALGAATLAAQSKTDISTLRQNVTSKGGTTEQALKSFENSNLPQIIAKAVIAARDRGRELSKL